MSHEHSSFFDGLPICIVCGRPILKDCPAVQFPEGVACNRKRPKQRHTCAELGRLGVRWIKGLAAAPRIPPANAAKVELEAKGPKAPEPVLVPSETLNMFEGYDPAAEARRRYMEANREGT